MHWLTFLIVAAIAWPPVVCELIRQYRFRKMIARHRAADHLRVPADPNAETRQ